jgi:hypothetical protein
MGIKFNCPNGHKLNVKSFLAGRKGVCPHCGASFRIPSDQQADGDDGDEAVADHPPQTAAPTPAAKSNGAPAVSAPAMGSVVPTTVRPVHPSQPQGAIPQAGIPQGTVPHAVAIPTGMPPGAMPVQVMPAAAVPAASAVPVASGRPLVHPGAIDPIAEAPLAAWYVRPPSGGQYGPARGDVMRKWIVEGRVSSDSLVWREGWQDWRSAGQLFPSLANGGADAAPSPVPAAPLIAVSTRSSSKTMPRKRGNGLAVAGVVILALLCVGLASALVYLFVLNPVQ